MTRILYRLIYRDGSVSGWSSDYNRMKANAERFRARLETKVLR